MTISQWVKNNPLYPVILSSAVLPNDQSVSCAPPSSQPKDFKNTVIAIHEMLIKNEIHITRKTLRSICTLITQIVSSKPVFIKKESKSKFEATSSLKNSICVIIQPSTIEVYVSLAGTKYTIQTGFEQKVRIAAQIVFDSSNYCLLSVTEVAKGSLKYGEERLNNIMRRFSIMQTLGESSFFPQNFAFLTYKSKKKRKFVVFQELAISGDLIKYMAGRPRNVSLQERMQFYEDMICAVMEMHKKNICHKDLKPENFLVCNGRLKLTDFGLSAKRSDPYLQSPCGSLAWGSPELIRLSFEQSKDLLGPAIDIYGLGNIFHTFEYDRIPHAAELLLEFDKNRGLIRQKKICIQKLARMRKKSFDEMKSLFKLMMRQPLPPRDLTTYQTIEILKQEHNSLIEQHEILKRRIQKQKTKVRNLEKNCSYVFAQWKESISNCPPPPSSVLNMADLVNCMLQSDPSQRITLSKALALIKKLKK